MLHDLTTHPWDWLLLVDAIVLGCWGIVTMLRRPEPPRDPEDHDPPW